MGHTSQAHDWRFGLNAAGELVEVQQLPHDENMIVVRQCQWRRPTPGLKVFRFSLDPRY
jgi:hypothetical protein